MSQSRQSKSTAAAGTAQEADMLVETYAEDLMDDIFDDVDRILAGEESAIYAASVIQSQEASLADNEAVAVPAMIVPFAAQQAVEPRTTTSIAEGLSSSSAETDKQTPPSKKFANKRRWSKLLLGAACLSALTALGVWWVKQQPSLQTASSPAVSPTVVSNETASTSAISQEAAFGEYLKRSLRVIRGERVAQIETQSSGGITNPPVSSSANLPAERQPGRNVIERVFVPLLQPGSGTIQNAPAATPSLPAPNTVAQPGTTTAPVPNIAVANTYELVGVLELGDRSAALFEVNGSSQRVYIGETIGGSGWSIVSINDEEVVVRRNGEVRSIYIGQQF